MGTAWRPRRVTGGVTHAVHSTVGNSCCRQVWRGLVTEGLVGLGFTLAFCFRVTALCLGPARGPRNPSYYVNEDVGARAVVDMAPGHTSEKEQGGGNRKLVSLPLKDPTGRAVCVGRFTFLKWVAKAVKTKTLIQNGAEDQLNSWLYSPPPKKGESIPKTTSQGTARKKEAPKQ